MLMLGVAVAVGAFGVTAAFARSPDAITKPATAVGPHTAVLQGVVNPRDKASAYAFEYGATTAYGKFTPAVSLGKGKTDIQVNATLTGLQAGTTYHFRVVASNNDGISRGSDASFTTTSDPLAPTAPSPAPGETPTTPQPTGTPAPLPAPVLGKSVNVAPALGKVLLRGPGSANPVPLDGASSIPVGAVLDTRQGVVDLTTALPGGDTQGAIVHGGLFQVRQAASGNGMTELVLRGPEPSCAKGNARAAATSGRRPPRRLWASDHHGRFRTRGSNAVATVRGTSWFMSDRCDGTYTRVKQGTVAVRELRTGRTIVLRAGQSRLSRAAR
jgi:hypothetical protein